jgi:hypothetical protein
VFSYLPDITPHSFSSDDALVGGGIFHVYFSTKIPLNSPNPGTKLAPNKKHLQMSL